jgi:hypothetical protein
VRVAARKEEDAHFLGIFRVKEDEGGGLCACAGRFDFCLGSHNFKNGFFHFWVPCALLGCQKAPTSLHAPQCCYSHSLRRASAI